MIGLENSYLESSLKEDQLFDTGLGLQDIDSDNNDQIDWIFKEDAPIYAYGEDFWYSLNEGYIKPEEYLFNPSQLKDVQDAITVLKDFETALEDAGLIEEI